MPEPRVVRVEIEYDNGDVYRASKEDAAELWDTLMGGIALAGHHGTGYGGPQLEKVEKPRMMRSLHFPHYLHEEVPICQTAGCVKVKP
jgi:hypothetical protein